MRTPDEAKSRAKKLREILNELGYKLKHAESLEAVSKLRGYPDWNTYSARLNRSNTLLPIPSGWFISGSHREFYECGCDAFEKYKGNPAATIRSKIECDVTDQSMATFMQVTEATEYLGSRVKLSATIKSIDVEGAVTIWLRIDGPGKHNMLALNNLENNNDEGVLKGTTDWQERCIVLDVPDNAECLNFGFYLRGKGMGHAADFSLERVDEHTSASVHKQKTSLRPINLDFSDTDSNYG